MGRAPESSALRPALPSGRVVFDFSKYLDYMAAEAPSGIARVDLAYAEFLAGRTDLLGACLHDRFHIRTRFSARTLGALARDIRREWHEDASNDTLTQVQQWLAGARPELRRIGAQPRPRRAFLRKVIAITRGWPYHNPLTRLPRGAIYLNTSYANLKHPGYLDWLARRKDAKAVFMVHDLLPLAHPEWFWDGARENFSTQIDTILRHGTLVVTPSGTVAEQVRALARQKGRPDLAVRAIPLPAGAAFHRDVAPVTGADRPYFVMCATLEPRKNHLMLFEAWRQLIGRMARPPRLLVVGSRGWKHEAITEALERDEVLKGHVLEVSGLPTPALAALMRGAQAVVLPSRDEGYGLPLVEARALGVPMIASDTPVFREVGRDGATLLTLETGLWAETIEAFASDPERHAQACQMAMRSLPLTWDGYFAHFLEALVEGVAGPAGVSR